MFARSIVGGLAIACSVSSPALDAQLPRPLIPLPDEGLRVVPFFDGWYANPDGSVTLLVRLLQPEQQSGGDPARSGQLHHAEGVRRAATDDLPDCRTSTRRTAAVVAVPAGVCSQRAAKRPGRRRRRKPRSRQRQRPGRIHRHGAGRLQGRRRVDAALRGPDPSVPARSKSIAYQLSWPAAMGSTPPLLRFQPSGTAARGPTGIQAPPLQAKVGTPPVADDLAHRRRRARQGADQVREGAARHERVVVQVRRARARRLRSAEGGVPGADGPIDDEGDLPGSRASTWSGSRPTPSAIRMRRPGNQCCWTNGYQKVTVTR